MPPSFCSGKIMGGSTVTICRVNLLSGMGRLSSRRGRAGLLNGEVSGSPDAELFLQARREMEVSVSARPNVLLETSECRKVWRTGDRSNGLAFGARSATGE